MCGIKGQKWGVRKPPYQKKIKLKVLKPPQKTDLEKFNSKYVVNQITGCWEWEGHRNHGYGTFSNKTISSLLAHRWSYNHYIGDPTGMLVCHHCDNPPCVNPFHLFLGTTSENKIDSVKKGRVKRMKHPSYSTYIQGCRCEDCKEAHRVWKRDAYKRSKNKNGEAVRPYKRQEKLLSLSS